MLIPNPIIIPAELPRLGQPRGEDDPPGAISVENVSYIYGIWMTKTYPYLWVIDEYLLDIHV